MQKKLIALAVASALTVPVVALADTGNVTIYGNADVSYDFVNSGTATAGTGGIRSQRVSSNTSYIGLKGSEDLGGGLSAVWQVESLIDISGASNAASTFATRNTFAGLSSANYGTVILGRHDTPYKIATRGLDQFGNGIADNRSLMGVSTTQIALGTTATAFDGRQPDVLAYISPAMAGFTVAVGYVNLNQALNSSQSVAGDGKAHAWSLAGLYGNGPFFGSLAYETHRIGAGNFTALGTAINPTYDLKEDAWKFGFGYTQDLFNVGLAYEKTKDNMGAVVGLLPGQNVAGHSAWYLGGKYNFTPNDGVKLAYSRAGDLAAIANTKANQWSLGYDHSMSKRTTIYALYTTLRNGSASGYQLSNNASSIAATGPLFANPAGAGNALAGVGAKPSAVSFGLKHTF